MPGLIVRPRSRIFHGHDWVYASEVLKPLGQPQDGEVVTLKTDRDQLLGSAIYNARSVIVARRFSRQRQDLDLDFFQRRIRLALQYRARHGIDMRLARLVWSESDGLPGLIVDRYGDHLVLQTLTLGMDLRRDLIVEVLRGELAPASIVERNDSPVRQAEGLELRTGMLHGTAPEPFVIEVDGVSFEVDLMRGQKTGLYLDQLASYRAVAPHAAGRRVLDCFSNAGGFALACARAGAKEVTAVEISAECVEQIKRNAARNQLRIETHAANVFDILHDLERQDRTFDLIILDPPSFTKSKNRVDDARRGYKEIHLRALKLLAPDGLLATYCCSHHVSAQSFRDIINEAVVDSKKTLRQLATYTQSLDHPIVSTLPETEYLKGFLFELMPGR
ncbi:MAG: class I SAM-dependent rRNA methyltransferase [Chthoniobacteraceae bacterium]